MDILKRLNAKIINELFLVSETIRSRVSSNRKMKILFSREQDLEAAIQKGFRFTQHEVSFEALSLENIKSYDLVVPLTVHDLKYLNEVRHLMIDNPIPIPSMQSLALCDDKYLFNQVLMEKGFGNFIPKIGDALAYPYILKKRIDQWSLNSHIISDQKQEQNFSDALADPEYFCQAFIPGPYEYATHILFKDQRIVCSINIEYAFKNKNPIKGKDKLIYTKVCPCPYLDLFSSILTLIGFEGLCCFNYKVVDSNPFILEINPRFGGSLRRFFFSFVRHLDAR